ncbi:hypothetical protein KDA11_02440 [Candidatus Saccharibacteria bacterium]|nr:hypothetical protein [Candidatus Saccharibacteria bacterium]
MKVIILYHPRSEHARIVEDFARDFTKQHDRKIELISLESRDGAATASLYDITIYPSIIALSDDGQILKIWQGSSMPLMSEVSYYTR